ncbi:MULTISPECIES: hypothetical protein [unclassified Hyphomicrobium]|nr:MULTISPECIES: hypothetical protein [unclassified Hyphomicrobium]
MEIFVFAVWISTIEDAENQVPMNESLGGDSERAALSTHVEESLPEIDA